MHLQKSATKTTAKMSEEDPNENDGEGGRTTIFDAAVTEKEEIYF
jgi:hypothetical protein